MSNVPVNYQPTQVIDPQLSYVGSQYIPQYYVPKYSYPQPQMQMQGQQYIQPLNQTQPVQQVAQQQGFANLSGKMVDSIDVVRATDIPMDGGTYYFPKADHTEVYSKRWLANGTTETLVYKLYIEQPKPQEPAPVVFPVEEWNGRFDSVEERLSRLEKAALSPSKPAKAQTQKEEAK